MSFKLFSITLWMVFLLSSCTQLLNYFDTSAIDYNDAIVEVYNDGLVEYIEYDTYYIETSWEFFDNIENRRVSAIENIQQQKLELEQIWDYQWDSTLINAAIQNFKDIVNVLSDEYRQLLDIYVEFEQGELNLEGYEVRMQEIANDIALIDEAIIARMEEAQSRFASEYNFEILPVE